MGKIIVVKRIFYELFKDLNWILFERRGGEDKDVNFYEINSRRLYFIFKPILVKILMKRKEEIDLIWNISFFKIFEKKKLLNSEKTLLKFIKKIDYYFYKTAKKN